jgi:hypothetical protein
MGISIDLWDVVRVGQRKWVYCVLYGPRLVRSGWQVKKKVRNSDRVGNDGLDLRRGGSWFVVVCAEHRCWKRARSRKICWRDQGRKDR